MNKEQHPQELNALLKKLADRGIVIRLDHGLTKVFNWFEITEGIEFYIDGRIIIKPEGKQ